MTVLLIATVALVLWLLVPLPLAVAVGRAFRAAEDDAAFAEILRDYEAAGV